MSTVTPNENYMLHWYTCIMVLHLSNDVHVEIPIVLVSSVQKYKPCYSVVYTDIRNVNTATNYAYI